MKSSLKKLQKQKGKRIFKRVILPKNYFKLFFLKCPFEVLKLNCFLYLFNLFVKGFDVSKIRKTKPQPASPPDSSYKESIHFRSRKNN